MLPGGWGRLQGSLRRLRVVVVGLGPAGGLIDELVSDRLPACSPAVALLRQFGAVGGIAKAGLNVASRARSSRQASGVAEGPW